MCMPRSLGISVFAWRWAGTKRQIPGKGSMREIYVVGGELRQSVFRKLEEWQSCKKGVIVEIDTKNKTSRRRVEYVSPPEVCPKDSPGVQFKSASLVGDKLYTCTSTEVLIYSVPGFQLLQYVSLPCFN